ncbi:hypothetical protein FF32_10530 [Halomonas campaniensis]|nr:hypothetical protein FF32_10530 [Halomonas campaniensis]
MSRVGESKPCPQLSYVADCFVELVISVAMFCNTKYGFSILAQRAVWAAGHRAIDFLIARIGC